MTQREVFNDVVNFRRPARTPLWNLEGIAEQTLRLWIRQGHVPLGAERESFFRFDGGLAGLRFDCPPIPAFVPETIEEDAEHRTYIDRYGNTVRLAKASAVTPVHYAYLDGPVHGMADWREMKKRFDLADCRRLPLEWGEEMIEKHNASDSPTCVAMTWGPSRCTQWKPVQDLFWQFWERAA